jgi:hypothetical protein
LLHRVTHASKGTRTRERTIDVSSRPMDRRALFDTAARYLRSHPVEASRIVRSALGLRLGLPLDALRWLAEQASRSGKVEDLEIESAPPGFRIGATVEQMNTKIRASSTIYIERLRMNDTELRVELRLEETRLRVVGGAESPVAFLVRSGALDVSNPGTLVKHLPAIPPVVVEAEGKRIVLDLAKLPQLADQRSRVRRAVGAITSLITLHGVETDEGHVDVTFRALPSGVLHAAKTVRENVVGPAARRALRLLPQIR